MTDALPTDLLEQRAAGQRQRLHDSVLELRRHLDIEKNARNHLGPVAAVTAILALVLGYGIAGALSD